MSQNMKYHGTQKKLLQNEKLDKLKFKDQY